MHVHYNRSNGMTCFSAEKDTIRLEILYFNHLEFSLFFSCMETYGNRGCYISMNIIIWILADGKQECHNSMHGIMEFSRSYGSIHGIEWKPHKSGSRFTLRKLIRSILHMTQYFQIISFVIEMQEKL